MTERGTIGSILLSAGRITEDDVAMALAHQRDHGGFFGEALIACEVVTESELEWGLAEQADLPYVFPQAESIDFDAASLVSPEWALTHLTLPILKTADAITVIVESPLKTEGVEELRALTALDVELALASPSKIRELIREVYARASAADEDDHKDPVSLGDAWDLVLRTTAPSFGISARGSRATVWWDEGGAVRRRPLSGDWMRELERSLTPGPESAAGDGASAGWEGTLRRAGIAVPVEVRYLKDESGLEYLFSPGAQVDELEQRFPLPTAGVHSEVQILARTGRARFVVTSDPPSLGREILPHLPDILLDPSWRSIYVNAMDRPAATEAFSHRLSDDPTQWSGELEALRAFRFDVVTADLSGGPADWPASALDVASVAFLLWSADEDYGPAYEAGIRWHLHIGHSGEGEPDWTLEALHA